MLIESFVSYTYALTSSCIGSCKGSYFQLIIQRRAYQNFEVYKMLRAVIWLVNIFNCLERLKMNKELPDMMPWYGMLLDVGNWHKNVN